VIVVLDANILARGALNRTTAVSAILDAWRADTFALAISTHIMAETARTLQKPYFAQRLDRVKRLRYQELLYADAQLVPITAHVEGVATTPKDDLVLATALSATADYLVTRDVKLLRLGFYQGVTIVSPTELLGILRSEPR
jgi:putative PIN family toxin of toxin-antitoxin system